MANATLVLLVVSDPKMRELLHARLRRFGHGVTCAQDLYSGMDAAGRKKYSVVLVEFSLVTGLGRSTIERMTKTSLGAPVILLSFGQVAYSSSGSYYGRKIVRVEGSLGALQLQNAVAAAVASPS